MIEAYNSTLPYRIAFAIVFFLILGVRDWILHRENPTRVKEYLFLVVSMLFAIVYGIFHDHITCTISPHYFLNAKGLDSDPRPFRIAVTWLAVKASYGPGVLAGALMLIANNPKPEKPQLAYRHLLRICVYPVCGAVLCAVVCGALVALVGNATWLADSATAYAPRERGTRFLAVWGIHAGSYIGATLGTVVAVASVLRCRNAMKSTDGASGTTE